MSCFAVTELFVLFIGHTYSFTLKIYQCSICACMSINQYEQVITVIVLQHNMKVGYIYSIVYCIIAVRLHQGHDI